MAKKLSVNPKSLGLSKKNKKEKKAMKKTM